MGSADRELVNAHLEKMLGEAQQKKIPEDLIGRLLVAAAVGLWRNSRSVADIAAELQFTIDNLDPDTEYPFMRP